MPKILVDLTEEDYALIKHSDTSYIADMVSKEMMMHIIKTGKPVVTCGECKYKKKCRDFCGNEHYICEKRNYISASLVTDNNYFCSNGERE